MQPQAVLRPEYYAFIGDTTEILPKFCYVVLGSYILDQLDESLPCTLGFDVVVSCGTWSVASLKALTDFRWGVTKPFPQGVAVPF